MMSISVEAAEARDSLSDDKEIVNSYEVRLVLLIVQNVGFVLKCNNACPNVTCICSLIFHYMSMIIPFTEVNSSGWETEVCISSCRISQGRDWKTKVCVFLSAL